jgi:hypothetical protein
MATWYCLWSFGIFFPFWYVRTKKNLATLVLPLIFHVSNFFRRSIKNAAFGFFTVGGGHCVLKIKRGGKIDWKQSR